METIDQSLRQFEDPIVIYLHMGRKTSKVASIISVNPILAHVSGLLFVCAVVAAVVRVPEWTHCNVVSYLQRGDFLAQLGDLSDDLVTYTAGKLHRNYIFSIDTPHFSRMHDVGVAERSMQYLEPDFSWFGGKELEGILDEVRLFAGEDPGDAVGFVERGIGVEWVVDFLHDK